MPGDDDRDRARPGASTPPDHGAVYRRRGGRLVGRPHGPSRRPRKAEDGFNYDGGAPAELYVGALGADRWRAHVHGISSHAGCHPDHGVSAALIASRAIADVAARGFFGKIVQGKHRGTSNVGIDRRWRGDEPSYGLRVDPRRVAEHDPKFVDPDHRHLPQGVRTRGEEAVRTLTEEKRADPLRVRDGLPSVPHPGRCAGHRPGAGRGPFPAHEADVVVGGRRARRQLPEREGECRPSRSAPASIRRTRWTNTSTYGNSWAAAAWPSPWRLSRSSRAAATRCPPRARARRAPPRREGRSPRRR